MKNLKGLTPAEVDKSKELYGVNELSKKERDSIFSMFLEACSDIWIKVLFGALLFKVFMVLIGWSTGNDVYEIISILVAIALSTGFSTITEYKNTSRADALQEEYNKTYAKVMRDGKLCNILTSEIVKDDIVLIQAGDKVPVDGLLVQGSVKVSQAALNGESRDESKIAVSDMEDALSTDYNCTGKVFMGSVVTSGEAYMVATVIGDATELGIINKSLTEDDEEGREDTSSLKLKKVAKNIGKLGTIAAAIAACLNVILNLAQIDAQLSQVALLLAESVMLFTSIIIMAVPEGLPMMNSMVQGMNTESLYKKHILVSHKAAFADSAYLDILFSDKTGTITEGCLSLVEFIMGDGSVINYIQDTEFLKAITLNNLAKVASDGSPVGSNNMDRALLSYALNHGYKDGMFDNNEIEQISGFDSEKKCATVDMKNGVSYWKGATENIIDSITHYMDKDGEKVVFTKENKAAVLSMMKTQAKRSMKMLSVVRFDGAEILLQAILCLRDNVRKDAIETVHTLNQAGIQVVMVTGDAEDTAVAIARDAGILQTDDDIVLTHDMLAAMSDEDVQEILPRLRVVSRAKPMDKKRLVSLAQKLDHVVGMTGDGVNDSPALKQSDVGFAMGDGTSVAQEAGDVVILDNSLTSIKDCVLNSRTMAKSVGKFLIFQLTVNVSTILMNLIAPILGWMEPFTIVQILWINLIMDTLAALAFGKEPVLNRYMQERPVKRQDSILTTNIRTAIATAGVFITLVSILLLENVGGIVDAVLPTGSVNLDLYERTFMFAFFIYAVIFNAFNTRSEHLNLLEHMKENKNFIFVMSGIFIMQTIIIQIGGVVFGTVPLTLKALGVAMVLGFCIIPFDMCRKLILHHHK